VTKGNRIRFVGDSNEEYLQLLVNKHQHRIQQQQQQQQQDNNDEDDTATTNHPAVQMALT
jgi:hypothetical protein